MYITYICTYLFVQYNYGQYFVYYLYRSRKHELYKAVAYRRESSLRLSEITPIPSIVRVPHRSHPLGIPDKSSESSLLLPETGDSRNEESNSPFVFVPFPTKKW